MPGPLTLMAVHAHPDDEAIGTGGVLARAAAEGIRTVLVTCTGGEVGEIAPDTLATADTLAEVRERELRAACEILNVTHLELLGYRDSGMAGTPDNDHPECFAQADLDHASARLASLVRKYQPAVIVTYNENGFYGHSWLGPRGGPSRRRWPSVGGFEPPSRYTSALTVAGAAPASHRLPRNPARRFMFSCFETLSGARSGCQAAALLDGDGRSLPVSYIDPTFPVKTNTGGSAA